MASETNTQTPVPFTTPSESARGAGSQEQNVPIDHTSGPLAALHAACKRGTPIYAITREATTYTDHTDGATITTDSRERAWEWFTRRELARQAK